MKPLNIAHISDLHFSKFVPSLSQFFSKRWIGNLNLLFSRDKTYVSDQLFLLPKKFKELGIDTVIVAGDLSTTSLPEEFGLAKEWTDLLEKQGMKVFLVPGNHDQYTRSAYRNQDFYKFFQNELLASNQVALQRLNDQWWVVLLDTACATSWISSRGSFSEQIEKSLKEVLQRVPEHASIILCNHFPLFQNDSKRKELKGAKRLQKVLLKAHPRIKLYLNGHTHRHCIADLRTNNFPIVLDSGSASHKKIGTWNHIQIRENKIHVQPYRILSDNWQKFDSKSQAFTLQPAPGLPQ